MPQNLGKNVATVLETSDRSLSKVIYREGRPISSSELNQMQEISTDLLRRLASAAPSGWVSPKKVSIPGYVPYFMSQSPNDATPENAIVAGMPIEFSSTNQSIARGLGDGRYNVIDMSMGGSVVPPLSGNRVDGVFLEVWRAVVSEEGGGPQQAVTAPDLKSVATVALDGFSNRVTRAVAVGTSGTIMYSPNSSDPMEKWVILKSPTNSNLNSVTFISKASFIVVGDHGEAYRTDDLGESWSALDMQTNQDLLAISYNGVNDLIVVGNAGTVMKSVDGGFSFVSLLGFGAGSSGSFTSVSSKDSITCVSGTNGYIGYVNGSSLMRSLVRDNGVAVADHVTCVSVVNQLEAWAVTAKGKVLRSTDACRSFFSVDGSILESGSTDKLSSRIAGSGLTFVKVLRNDPVAVRLTLNSSFYRVVSYEVVPGGININWSTLAGDTGITTTLWNDTPGVASGDTAITSALQQAAPTPGQIPGYIDPLSIPKFFSTVSLEWVSALDVNYGGVVPAVGYANLAFSMTDTIIIGGASGVCYRTDDSGLSWVVEKSAGGNLNDFAFFGRDRGVAVGSSRILVNYSRNKADRDLTPGMTWEGNWLSYPAEMAFHKDRRFYFEGNINAPGYLNPKNDSILSSIGIETSAREQIQYQLRVVPNVNASLFQEAGLGDSDVLAVGPMGLGGSTFENMGPINGDYGCWRASCLGTTDGYCYAIPMFLVRRRNSAPFDPVSNPNGVGSSRPDGVTSADYVSESDVVDVRKDILGYASHGRMGDALMDVFSNRLTTNFTSTQGGVVNAFDASDTFSSFGGLIEGTSGTVDIGSTLNLDSSYTPVFDIPAEISSGHASFDPVSYKVYATDKSGSKSVPSVAITGLGTRSLRLLGVVKTDTGIVNAFTNDNSSIIGMVSPNYGTAPVFVFGNSVDVVIQGIAGVGIMKAGSQLIVGGNDVMLVKDAIITGGYATFELDRSVVVTDADMDVKVPTSKILVLPSNDENKVYTSITAQLGVLSYAGTGLSNPIKNPLAVYNLDDGSAHQMVFPGESRIARTSADSAITYTSALEMVGSPSPQIVTLNTRLTYNSDSRLALSFPATISIGSDAVFLGHLISVSDGVSVIPLELGIGGDTGSSSGYVMLYEKSSGVYMYEVVLPSSYSGSVGTKFRVTLAATDEETSAIFGTYRKKAPQALKPKVALVSPRKRTIIRFEESAKVTGVGKQGVSLNGAYAPAMTVSAGTNVPATGYNDVCWHIPLTGTSIAYLRPLTSRDIAGTTVVFSNDGNGVVYFTKSGNNRADGSYAAVYEALSSQSVAAGEALGLEVIVQPERAFIFTSGRGPGYESSNTFRSPLEQIPFVPSTPVTERIVGTVTPLTIGGKKYADGSYSSSLLSSTGVSRDVTLSGLRSDASGRSYYSKSGSMASFSVEPCDLKIPRVMVVPFLAIARGGSIKGVIDGEVVLVIVSAYLVDEENVISIGSAGNAVTSIYKMQRPSLYR